MKSPSINIKKKSQKSSISTNMKERPQKYINKNIPKKYIYKKEKAADTEKILQNNKLSKNYIFSPIHTKKNDSSFKNSIKSDLRRPPEMREDVNIDYEKYQQQTIHMKTSSVNNFNFLNNDIINNTNLATSPTSDSNLMNQSYFLLERKNGFMVNSNRSVDNLITNKWRCPQCGNVNSNFNYLCNNCNLPNTSTLNDTLNNNQRNNSTGKNINAFNIEEKNIINRSFNDNLSNNDFSRGINNKVMKKNKTKSEFNFNDKNNTLSSPYNRNIGFNTIRPNKNNSNYFYNEPINNSINNSTSNFFETDRDSNITHLYSYSNYLANELKSSNDATLKLMENYQNNETEYKNIYEQNDLIKKKIKILKEKENQLDKINDQLKKSLQYINKKFLFKNNDKALMKSLIENEDKNYEDIKSKINKYNEENIILEMELKDKKDIIIKMKKKIELLSEEKNKDYDVNIILKEKIDDIIEIKKNIEEYTKEIREQNQIYLNNY